MPPSSDIDASVIKLVDECDFGLVLLSDNYCLSENCEEEFLLLLEKEKPLFLVETEDVWDNNFEHRLEHVRDRVKRVIAVPFWGQIDGVSDHFGWPEPDTAEGERVSKYNESLWTLRAGIYARAKDFLAQSDAITTHGLSSHPTDGHTVYLACPTGDVKPYVDKLEAALHRDGHSVCRLDPSLFGKDAESAHTFLNEMIGEADVFVQVYGASPGRSTGDADNSPLVSAQHDLARDSCEHLCLWRSSKFDMEDCDPTYAEFLRDVACHISSFEEFVAYVRQQVSDLLKSKELASQRTDRMEGKPIVERRPFVAIDAARSDIRILQALHACLQEHVNVDSLPFDIGRSDLTEAVALNDAIVLVYGETAEGRKRVKSHYDMFRRDGSKLETGDLALAFGDAKPKPPDIPPCPAGPNISIINVDELHVDEASIASFLTRLGI